MIKFKLDTRAIQRDLFAIGDQHVVVGVLNKSAPAKRPARPLRQMALMPGVVRNAVDRRKSKREVKLAEVAGWLEEQRGLFSEAMEKAGNKELSELVEAFALLAQQNDPVIIRRLENACRSIVRNPMIRREYGDNSDATAKDKGFDHWGINTGTLFKAIEAKYGRD